MMSRWQRLPQAAGAISAVLLLLFGLLVVSQADRDYRFQQEQRSEIRAAILAASVTAAVDFGGKSWPSAPKTPLESPSS